MWASFGYLFDNVGVVLDVVKGDEEYGFDVLDGVDPLLPGLRLGVPQILSDLLELTEDTAAVLRIQDGLQEMPLTQS